MLTRLMLALAFGVVAAGCSNDPHGATRASLESPAAVFAAAADALAARDMARHARHLSRADQSGFACSWIAVARWATSRDARASAEVEALVARYGVGPDTAPRAGLRRLDLDLDALVGGLEPFVRARGKAVVFSPQDPLLAGRRLTSVELDGDRARGTTDRGATVRFVRELGRWKLDGAW